MNVRAAIASLASLGDAHLDREVGPSEAMAAVRFRLYGALRAEQRAIAEVASAGPTEVVAILAQAQSAFRDLEALLLGRDDALLDSARENEWSLRDLLRHLIAVEFRYCAQVVYSAERGEREPIAIPEVRLPCDRLAPPEREFGATRSAGLAAVLGLFDLARTRSDKTLSRLSTTDLERPSDWGSLRVDVRTRLHQIAAHIVEGTVQAEKMLTQVEPFREARAIVRRIWRARGLHERSNSSAALAHLDAELIALGQLSSGGLREAE